MLLFAGVGFAQGGIVYIPQVGHGMGMETSFVFMNLSATTNRLEVKVFDSNGNPVDLLEKPGSAFEGPSPASVIGVEVPGYGTSDAVTLTSNPNALQVGYAEISSDFNDPFGVEAVFRVYSGSSLITATSVLPVDPVESFSFIAFADGSNRSGIALLNPAENGADADVSLILMNHFGDVVDELAISLEAGVKTTMFVDEIFSDYFSTSGNFIGSVEVNSNVPLTATIIKMEGSFFTTQTVQPSRNIQ